MAHHFDTKQLLTAVIKSGGIYSTIAKKLGCDWHTAKTHVENNPVALQAYADEKETILDACESAVITKIQKGDPKSVQWYLTMKGKERGYSNTLQIESTTLSSESENTLEKIMGSASKKHTDSQSNKESPE